MSVTLLEVMAAARTRAASLVAEVTGYLVLGVADQVLGAPRALAGHDVLLAEDGVLRVAGGRAASEIEAESGLRALLKGLLAASVSVTPALLRASDKPPAGGIAALVRELEAALIPVNRGAARRALARLYRDVDRARANGRLAVPAEPPPAVAPALPPPVIDLPEVLEHDSPALFDVDCATPLTPEPEAGEPITAPEPIVQRRSIPEPALLSPMVPSPIVVWDVPELELPPSPQISDAVYESHQTEPPLELAGPDATERAPTLMTLEVTAPLPAVAPVVEPPTPSVPQAAEPLVLEPPNLDDLIDDAPWHQSSEHTPALGDLVTVARAMRGIDHTRNDPDEIVIEPERTEPLPKVATPPPPAWVAAEFDELIGLEPKGADAVLASEAPALEPEPERTPIAPLPVIALEPLVPAPARPRPIVPAPPRFQARQSSVESLVADFQVSAAAPERAVCEDLKRLAGVDRTSAPPAVATRTPPPVEVGSDDSETALPVGRRSRIGLSVLALALVASGAGAVSSAVSSPSRSAAAHHDPVVAQVPSCSATLELTGVPRGARTLVRVGALGTARIPSRVDGDVAVFDGLKCREPLEVTVGTEFDGLRRWVRIPVSADAMSPSQSTPSEVRVALSVD